MKSKIQNKKAFAAALVTIRSTGKVLRNQAQETVLYGFEHALAHGDVEFLNRAFKACIGEAKLDTKQMLGYIKAHMNVELKSPNKPREGFKKRDDKNIKYKVPTVTWFNYEKVSGANDALTDEMKSLETFIANMSKKASDHKFKDNLQACDIVAALNAVQAKFQKPVLSKVA